MIISNKTVNIGAMTSKCGAHAECGKNYKFLLWRPYFGLNSPLYGAKLLSNAWGIPWGRISGFGIDWYIMNLTSINMRKIGHPLFENVI